MRLSNSQPNLGADPLRDPGLPLSQEPPNGLPTGRDTAPAARYEVAVAPPLAVPPAAAVGIVAIGLSAWALYGVQNQPENQQRALQQMSDDLAALWGWTKERAGELYKYLTNEVPKMMQAAGKDIGNFAALGSALYNKTVQWANGAFSQEKSPAPIPNSGRSTLRSPVQDGRTPVLPAPVSPSRGNAVPTVPDFPTVRINELTPPDSTPKLLAGLVVPWLSEMLPTPAVQRTLRALGVTVREPTGEVKDAAKLNTLAALTGQYEKLQSLKMMLGDQDWKQLSAAGGLGVEMSSIERQLKNVLTQTEIRAKSLMDEAGSLLPSNSGRAPTVKERQRLTLMDAELGRLQQRLETVYRPLRMAGLYQGGLSHPVAQQVGQWRSNFESKLNAPGAVRTNQADSAVTPSAGGLQTPTLQTPTLQTQVQQAQARVSDWGRTLQQVQSLPANATGAERQQVLAQVQQAGGALQRALAQPEVTALLGRAVRAAQGGPPLPPEDDKLLTALLNGVSNALASSVGDAVQGALTGQPVDPQRQVQGAMLAFVVGMAVPNAANSLVYNATSNAVSGGLETWLRQAAGVDPNDPNAVLANMLFGAGLGVVADGIFKALSRAIGGPPAAQVAGGDTGQRARVNEPDTVVRPEQPLRSVGTGDGAQLPQWAQAEVGGKSVAEHLREYLSWSENTTAYRGNPPPVGAGLIQGGIDEATMRRALDGGITARSDVLASLGLLGRDAPAGRVVVRQQLQQQPQQGLPNPAATQPPLPPRADRAAIVSYEVPANPTNPYGGNRQVTVYPPGTQTEGELLANGALTAINNPRSYDSPEAAVGAAARLDTAHTVVVTENGSIERGVAAIRPDWNGKTSEPGTAYLGNVFGTGHIPTDTVDPQTNLSGSGMQATQGAIDLAFGNLDQQRVVGHTSGQDARDMYRRFDAPGQRVQFTEVKLDIEKLSQAYEIWPPAGQSHLIDALNSADPQAAINKLERDASLALNARDETGALLPLRVRDAHRQWQWQSWVPEQVRQFLSLDDGVVRYDFRFSRPDDVAPLPASSRGQIGLPAIESPRLLGSGAIQQRVTETGLHVETFHSKSYLDSGRWRDEAALREKNPLLYGMLSEAELDAKFKGSDFVVRVTQEGTSSQEFVSPARSGTAARATTAVTFRQLHSANPWSVPQGRYAELTLVANKSVPGGGPAAVRAAEEVAREQGASGVVLYNTDTSGGRSKEFYLAQGYTLVREEQVNVNNLDERVQRAMVEGKLFTQSEVDNSEAYVPRYYFKKIFDQTTGEPGSGAPRPSLDQIAPAVTPATPGPTNTQAAFPVQAQPQPPTLDVNLEAPGVLANWRMGSASFFPAQPRDELRYTIGTQPFQPYDPAVAVTTLDKFQLGTAALWGATPIESTFKAVGETLQRWTRPLTEWVVDIPSNVWDALPQRVQAQLTEIATGQPATTLPASAFERLPDATRAALRNAVVVPDEAWNSLPADVQSHLLRAAEGNVYAVQTDLRQGAMLRQAPLELPLGVGRSLEWTFIGRDGNESLVTRVAQGVDSLWKSPPVEMAIGTSKAIGFIMHKGVTALMVLEATVGSPKLHLYNPTGNAPITDASLEALTIGYVPKTNGTVAVTIEASLVPDTSITFWASGPVMRESIPRIDRKVDGDNMAARIISTYQANLAALGVITKVGGPELHWAQAVTLRPLGELGANPTVLQASKTVEFVPGELPGRLVRKVEGNLDFYGLGVVDPAGFFGIYNTVRVGPFAATPARDIHGIGSGYKFLAGTSGLQLNPTPYMEKIPPGAVFQTNPAHGWALPTQPPKSAELTADGLRAVWSVDAQGKPVTSAFVRTRGAFAVEDALFVDPKTGWMAIAPEAAGAAPLWLDMNTANAAKLAGQARAGAFDAPAFRQGWRSATADQWVQALQTPEGRRLIVERIVTLGGNTPAGRVDIDGGLAAFSREIQDPVARRIVESNSAFFKSLVQDSPDAQAR